MTFTAPGHAGNIVMEWNDRQTEAITTITGDIDGATLAAQRLAP